MSARAFVTIVTHPIRPGYGLIRGGPAEPLHQAADLAGVALRWDRAERGWTCPSDRIDDLVAAGEYAHCLIVREAS